MKAKDVLKVLKVTRPTLCRYVRIGRISVHKNPNGTYNYNDDDVYKVANIATERESVVYARVSTQKQKSDLENQISVITEFANKNGYKVSTVYSDIASGLNFDRKNFNVLLHRILNYEVKTVFVKNKDRLTRVSFDMWKDLFKSFNCEIVVVDAPLEGETEEREIFEDIISLLHCFAMQMYSARRKKKLTLIEEDMTNEISV